MSQLSAVLNRRTLSTGLRLGPGFKPTIYSSTIRTYSRKTKTKVETEASELAKEIQRLERMIAEQERKEAARKAYEESIRESRSRTEAAHSLYKAISSPGISGPHSAGSSSTLAASRISSGISSSQSVLPETFLEDLKLTFLDTRGVKEDALKQLQSGLSTAEELASSSVKSEVTDQSNQTEISAAATVDGQDKQNAVALERIREVGVDKWNDLIYVNALEGNSKNAEEAMKLMDEVGVQPNLETFGHLMEAYANAGELKKAENTIEMILKSGLVPTMSSYNSLMKLHVKRRDLTGAFGVFEALKQHHTPDVNVYTNLIKGCLRASEYDLGWKVFDQMQHSGATPVESTYSLMIHACAKTDQVERALDIFKTYPQRQLQPTDATFNSLIHACAMRPEYFATAFSLLNEMQNVYGFEPDMLTYNTLLFACSKRQDLLTARRIFQKVVQLDYEGKLQLDGVTVTNFLWCITEWKDTEVHLKNLKYRLRNPQAETAAPRLTASSTATDIAVASPYFMLPQHPPKDEYEALAEGESVFSWFVKRAADQFPFDAITTQGNRLEDAKETPETSEALEASESSDTQDASSTLSGIQKEESLALASRVPHPRSSLQSPIRARLLSTYLAMYVRHNDIEKSTEIYRHYFDHFQRKRDSWTYSTMLEGCYYWKDLDLGTEIFRDWRDWRKSRGKLTEKKSRQADYQCYRRMINLLARTNHLDESIALLQELCIAATPPNTRLLSDIALANGSSTGATSSPDTLTDMVKSGPLSFLKTTKDDDVLPIYPNLKDFPVVYTKTWELENDAARKLLLRLCRGRLDYGNSSSSSSSADSKDSGDRQLDGLNERYQNRHQKAIRHTSIKWKGAHPQEKGFYVGSRRMKELDRDVSKRGQDYRR
ncbi:hypothetical protein BGZ94_000132 [Podila epigama]|nr:hypothetical protein BGZ94_000132 [Podila epigama]